MLLMVKYPFFCKERPGPATIQFGRREKKANGESDAEKRVQLERVDSLIFALSTSSSQCI